MTTLDNPNLHETYRDDVVSLNLDNGYNYHLLLGAPKFTFCTNCYEEQCYHIEDDVCVMCGYSRAELDLT